MKTVSLIQQLHAVKN